MISMHITRSREMLKDIKRTAELETIAYKHLRSLELMEALDLAKKLEISCLEKRESIEALKAQARLEDLKVYSVKVKKTVRKSGIKTKVYTYWYASWRNGKKVKNVYIGSSRSMNYGEALTKARMLKAANLGIDLA